MRSSFVFGLLPALIICAPGSVIAAPVAAAALLEQQPPQSSSPRTIPRPAPAPIRPAPARPAALAVAAWTDAPLSPGRWIYQRGRGPGSRALFGLANAPLLTVACEPGRQISITRSGGAAGTLTIRTSSTARTLPGTGSPAGLRAQLPAGDPLLDAIAFSRGRFAVETPAASALVIPNWPELARVVEDCRR